MAIDALDKYSAVAGGAGIYLTTDGGNNWTKIYNGSIVDITMKTVSIIYAVTEHEIIRTTNTGVTWDTLYHQPANLGMLNFIKVFQNDLVAMADCDVNTSNSKAQFFRSSDGGATFTQMNQTYLANCWSMDVWRRVDFPTAQLGVFAYSVSGPIPHTVARTTDGGITWSNNDYGAGNYINVIKMYDDKYGIAQGLVANNAAVFVTNDGGINWRPNIKSMNTGQSITFVKNHPAEAFIATNNQLFYSADSGKTWSNQNFNNTRITDLVFADETSGWICTSSGQVYWTDNKGNAVVPVAMKDKIPTQYSLMQNYPNPFNPTTTIKYTLPFAETPYMASLQHVTLKIYDALGREITTLVNEEKSAGNYSVTFNASDFTSGIYFYQLRTNNYTETRKMILMK